MHATLGYPETNRGRFLRREISEKGSITRTWACLIPAMPISWKSTLQQYVGPAFSLHDNKRFVQVCDFVDNYVLMLARMYEAKDMPRPPLVSRPWQNRDKTPRVEQTWVAFERKADSPSC
jgi:hypothetical protein